MCYTTLPLGNSSKVHSFSFFFLYPAQLLPQASTSNHLAPSMPIAQGSKESGYSSVDSTSTRLSLPPSLSLSLDIIYVCTYPSGRPNFKLHKLQGTLHIYIVQSSSSTCTSSNSVPIFHRKKKGSERPNGERINLPPPMHSVMSILRCLRLTSQVPCRSPLSHFLHMYF